MAFVLAEELAWMCRDYGLENIGFLTLTFADHVVTIKEAQKRFHSLNTNVLRPRYKRAIGVWERQKSKRIHFHLVVTLDADIRTGFDFKAAEDGDYRSASLALRTEWAFWRKTAPAYRFGRTELLPVRSTAQGIARYVGKYIRKHIAEREEVDKGARVVRFFGFKAGERRMKSRFAWNTIGGWLWRKKLDTWAKKHGVESLEQLTAFYGPRWAWLLQSAIYASTIEGDYPSYSAYVRCTNMQASYFRAWCESFNANRDRADRCVRDYQLQPFETLQTKAFAKALEVPSEAMPRPG